MSELQDGFIGQVLSVKWHTFCILHHLPKPNILVDAGKKDKRSYAYDINTYQQHRNNFKSFHEEKWRIMFSVWVVAQVFSLNIANRERSRRTRWQWSGIKMTDLHCYSSFVVDLYLTQATNVDYVPCTNPSLQSKAINRINQSLLSLDHLH